MSVVRRAGLFLTLGFASGLAALVGACAGDDPVDPADAGVDAPFIDAGQPTPGDEDASDGGPADGATADVAPPPPDETPPGSVGDLAASADTHASVTLTWTAPADEADAGTVAAYELRYATTPITTEAEFAAATSVNAPTPLSVGTAETVTVKDLSPTTEYHFAIRAKDAAGNAGALSNDAVATTKARASLLVTEIAPVNTDAEGGDFVELVATAAGSVADLEIRQSSTLLFKLGALDVAVGDRIVVHAVGLPDASTGFSQEDASKDKASSTEPFASPDAYDVYSSTNGLVATNATIAVLDGKAYQDAVPYSNRDINASSASMTAFADAHAANAWTFSAPPVDADDDCATLLEAVNASANTSPKCGGWPGFLTAGSSIQRNGVVDTSSRADFFVAAQTRGADNAPFCAPEGAKLALTEVNPNAKLVELTATQGGMLRGFTVRRDPRAGDNGTLIGTLPTACAATGDVFVVHLGVPSASALAETAAKDELPAATNPGFYDGAWDFTATATLPFATSLVLAVRDPGSAYVGAAAFSSKSTAASSTYEQSLAFVQGLGLWKPADCGGEPCTSTTTPTARDLAASWSGVGALASEASCRRADPTSTPQAASWTVGASTFGQ